MLLGLGLLLVGGCGVRWRAAEPRRLQLGGPILAYRAALTTLQHTGYRIVRDDPHRGAIVALAKVDQQRPGGDSKRASFIAFQAYRDGSLLITVSGYHVKREEGLMHRKLADEVDDLRHAIYRRAQAMYDEAVQPTAGQPAAPPRN